MLDSTSRAASLSPLSSLHSQCASVESISKGRQLCINHVQCYFWKAWCIPKRHGMALHIVCVTYHRISRRRATRSQDVEKLCGAVNAYAVNAKLRSTPAAAAALILQNCKERKETQTMYLRALLG